MTNVSKTYEKRVQSVYIVECISKGQSWWLADWEGDPGRTLVIENAKVYKTEASAKAAITRAINRNPTRKACQYLMLVQIQVETTLSLKGGVG